MMREKRALRLGIVFIMAVILPSVALVVIGVRSIGREEAYVEKSLEATLQAEADRLAAQVVGELDSVLRELRGSAPLFAEPGDGGLQAPLEAWKRETPLVEVPFRLSPDFVILWPDPASELSESERLFLDQNREFLTGGMAVPFYQNIAELYTQEILRGGGIQSTQQAAQVIATDEAVRERIYAEVQEKGRMTLPRNVVPNQSAQMSPSEAEPPPSLFVSEPLRFPEITLDEPYGIVPRLIQDELHLLFWIKAEAGGFTGCSIERSVFRSRIATLLPAVPSTVRILTVLDESGRPLVGVRQDRDWSRPFAAQEISEILPGWEGAAFLADPNVIAGRAARTRSIVATLVGILFVAILAGGFVVIRGVREEIALAAKKTTFVANVSHELKTPLTSIRMFAEMLRDGRQADPAKRQSYLDIMVSESERLSRLIDNVLDFSRPEKARTYSKAELDLDELVDDTLQGIRASLERDGFALSRAVRTAAGLPVSVDAEAVKQVLLNLISNAVKYSAERRDIGVETVRDGDSAVVRVLDRGIGIAPRDARRIFREFYRVDDALASGRQGAGLGLTIASRIAQDHGGAIAYSPREGGGSCFEVRLPLQEGEASQEGEDGGRENPGGRG